MVLAKSRLRSDFSDASVNSTIEKTRMKQWEIGAIAGTTVALLTGLLFPGDVAAEGIVPAADGTGTQVNQTGSDHTITGGSVAGDQHTLFHSFTEFTLLTGESATFITDPTVLNILSRVTGGNPSLIDGLLQVSGSNANLLLMNPNGVLLGPNTALNLGGSFTVTTADQVNFATGTFGTVGTPDYSALVGQPQSFTFSAETPGSIVNAGRLSVSSGESVLLIGGQVLNTGTITAPGGEVIISAVEGGSLVRIEQEGSLLNLEVATAETTTPSPPAFTPLALPELLTGTAIAEATGIVVNSDGSIQLTTGDVVNHTAATVTITGEITVTQDVAGQVLVLGETVALLGAAIDAFGPAGGGTVRLGGDYQGQGSLPRAQTTRVDNDTTIRADAIASGEGGRVIVWADGATTFQGLITAQGGAIAGDGGLVETSGRQSLDVNGGQVQAGATQGESGLWLLDPSDIAIDATLATTIQNSLIGGTSVALSTVGGTGGNGDIQVVSDVVASASNNARLTLTASRYIESVAGSTISIFGGDLILNVNQEGLAELTNPTVNNALAVIGTVTGGTTLNLGAGTYQEGIPILLSQNLILNGAGANATILNGNNAYRVLQIGGGVTATVNNLTVANGTFVGDGAGIANFGNLTLTNSRVRANVARSSDIENGDGGGILNTGSLTLIDSLISDNQTTPGPVGNAGGGGGIFNTGTLAISGSTIRNNEAASGLTGGGGGGGIFSNGTLTISDSTLSNNTAGSGGGLNNTGVLDVSGSDIVGNAADRDGGGMTNNGTLTLTNTLLRNNTALSGGGLYNLGNLVIRDSFFAENQAQGADGLNGSTAGAGGGGGGGAGLGGALYLENGSVIVQGTTFFDNQAIGGDGGRGFPNAGFFDGNGSAGGGLAGGAGGAPGGPGGAGGFGSGGGGGGGSAIVGGAGGAGGFGGGGGGGGGRTAGFSGDPGGIAGFGGGDGGQGNASGAGGAGGGAGLGGALFVNNGSVNLANVTFADNGVSGGAAGINAFGGLTAAAGQGIGGSIFINAGGTVTLANSTVSGGRADIGGGIFNRNGNLETRSSLISGNTALTGVNLANTGSFVSSGNNLFGDNGSAGVTGATLANTDIVPIAPIAAILATTLANNGGLTPTLALVEGSPAIDAGSGSGPDQRGVAVVNGQRDIGAYEFGGSNGPSEEPPAPPPAPPSVDDEPEPCYIDCGPPPPPRQAPADQTERPASSNPDAIPTAEFEEHLQVAATVFEDFDSLKRAVEVTGVPPALVYARFVPAFGSRGTADAMPQTKGLPSNSETELAQRLILETETLPDQEDDSGIVESDDDILELVLVPPDGRPQRFVTRATRAEVRRTVQRFQNELTDRTRRRTNTYLEPAQQLYGWLVTPMEESLAANDIGHLSFILDKGLRSLPLAALHDGDQFIIENYSVGLMPSLTLTDTRIGNVRNASVLAMGASEFEDQPPLPGVPLELAMIDSLWPGSQYLNEAFTPETIVEARNQTPYSILHLATHGQFVNGKLSDSYIQFWDQRLSLSDLPALQLSDPAVELLVLSACRTVLSGEQAELGFAGLAVKSGAKSAVAALWQVSDLETAGLMAEFYTQLGQAAYKAEALRQAQLAMLRGEVTVKDGQLIWSGGSQALPDDVDGLAFADTRHPYYWASFTLVGSPW